MEINRINVGLRIEQRINELKMSKAEFGRLIGIPQQNVNRILDRANIDTEKLADISEVLNYNFFREFVPTNIISADNGSIVAGGNVHGGMMVHGNQNNYNDSIGEVAVLKERVKYLEELLTEKERLIKVYEKIMEGK